MASTQTNTGMGLTSLLTAVFVTAKVFGFMPVAAWSWWWVLCPIWISLGITLAIVVVALIGCLIYALLTGEPKPRKYIWRK